MEKEVTREYENGGEIQQNISIALQLIDSARFMVSLLSNFVSYLSERFHRIKSKYVHDDKSCKTCTIKYTYCDCCLECKCLCSNSDKNKFILLLRKGVHPYEYMEDWGKFNEKSSEKEHFYSHLIMEDITDADYVHAKELVKIFQ